MGGERISRAELHSVFGSTVSPMYDDDGSTLTDYSLGGTDTEVSTHLIRLRVGKQNLSAINGLQLNFSPTVLSMLRTCPKEVPLIPSRVKEEKYYMPFNMHPPSRIEPMQSNPPLWLWCTL